ncbi:MAG: CPBP family intramembrane metalloprotease [Ignavibacteriales bacterium]|nr:CPBP family intramembrane metalloprotease [Ignavibacteriales bacterium]
MIKIAQNEIRNIKLELKKLDSKTTIIFLSSIILLTFSWYFANPKFFRESFNFIDQNDIIVEELSSFIYWFLFDFLLFIIIPIYIITLKFKENLKSYGLSFENKKVGFFYLVISILIFIPIIIFVSASENFAEYFPLMNSAKDEIIIFLIYECFFILFIFSWEFIFRGFILFGLEKKFGIYSIFIQMIPFVLLHSGKPFIETFASIIGGIILGYLALRTRSIIYGFLIHAFILITLDFISLLKPLI